MLGRGLNEGKTGLALVIVFGFVAESRPLFAIHSEFAIFCNRVVI